MRMMFIAAIAICGFANDCFADGQRRGVTFRCVTPCDILVGASVFIKDTGENAVGGVRKTVKGLGELITAPLKARISIPNKRTFRFQAPRIKIYPGLFEEIKPERGIAPPLRGLDQPIPLYYLPAPYKGRLANNLA